MINLFTELEEYGFRLPQSLKSIREHTYEAYFAKIQQKDSPWFNTYLSALEQTLLEAKCEGNQAEQLIASFRKAKAIQLADGAYTLFDELTFQNNALFSSFLSSLNLSSGLSQQCSTIRLVQYNDPIVGPGYIRTGDKGISLFSLSKKIMNKANVCAVGPVQLSKDLGRFLEGDEKTILNVHFDSAADAVSVVNNTLWSRLDNAPRVFFIHERLTQVLTAKYLCEKNELLVELMFSASRREKLIEAWDRLTRMGQVRFLRRTADFFFLKKGSSLVPTEIRDEFLTDSKGNKVFDLDLNSVIRGLEEGLLFPNLMISYLVLSMIPGVLAFGGASQNEYFYEIIIILEETFGHDRFKSLVSPSVKDLNVFFAGLINSDRYIKDSRSKQEFHDLYEKIQLDVSTIPIKILLGDGNQFAYFKAIQARSEKLKVSP